MQNNKMCKKPVYWDLINSNMNKRDVQTGCTGYVHKATIWVMRIWMFFSNSLVNVMRLGLC